MKSLSIPLVASALAVLALTAPTASADHSPECPTYDYDVGDASVGAGVNTNGQAVVRAAPAGYVFVDEVLFLMGSDAYIFSIWYYPEANGEPGPQRHDDYCSDSDNPDIWIE